MREEDQSVELEAHSPRGVVRDKLEAHSPKGVVRDKGLDELPARLQPTRSGRSLENYAPIDRPESPIERRKERKEAAEIAALKARLQHHDSLVSQWKVAQEELSAQKLAHATDAARMTEQVALLESRIEAAASDATRAVAAVSKQRNIWRTVAGLAGLTALCFLCVVWWQSRASRVSQSRPPVQAPAVSPVAQAGPVAPRAAFKPLPSDPGAALTTALDRLNGALVTVPQTTPEEVLKKITAATNDAGGCAIVWTNDLPSIVFGIEPVGPNSLAMTVEECAEAVESLR